MKFTCNRASLATAFSAVSGVIPARSAKPIIQNARLEVRKGEATLTGTDGETSVVYSVGTVESRNCEVLLPSKRTSEILRELKCEKLTFEIEDSTCRLIADRAEFRLPVADAAEYPAVSSFSDDTLYSIGGEALRTMIRRTIFATDPESARYALGGVLFEFGNERLTMVATDSRRLSRVTAAIPSSKSTTPCVVPQKALSLVERTIPDGDSTVLIAFRNESQVAFKMRDATVVSALVEGRFPKYQDVIPKSHEVSIDVISGHLHSVVRQAMIVTNEESRGVDFIFSEGSLVLASKAADVGESRVELPISFIGPELIIRLDPRFVAEFLKTVSSETTITWRLSNGDDPCLMQTEDGSIYVVMPLDRG